MAVDAGGVELFLVLLVAGHLLGDFALQSEAMAKAKGRGGVLLAHTGLVGLAHLVALAPLLSWGVAVVVVALTVVHGAIDFLKAQAARRRAAPLRHFFLDQAAHLLAITGAWALFVHWVGAPETRISASGLETFSTLAVLAAAFAFNATGGARVVSGVLALQDPSLEEAVPEGAGGRAGSGRLIGILERTVSLVLILVGQWAAIAILIAAKSIARFDELKDRRFSEYYLVGTLASLLVAIVTGLVLVGVLGRGSM